jgi:hypothetical protein
LRRFPIVFNLSKSNAIGEIRQSHRNWQSRRLLGAGARRVQAFTTSPPEPGKRDTGVGLHTAFSQRHARRCHPDLAIFAGSTSALRTCS